MNYFFASFQTVLADGRPFALSMNDGFVNANQVPKISGDDFVTLNGVAHKLDYTQLTETDSSDIMSQKHLKSVIRGLTNSNCDLTYTPDRRFTLTVYAVVFGVYQNATYGRYSGECNVENEKIEIDAWGFFEHVHWRG